MSEARRLARAEETLPFCIRRLRQPAHLIRGKLRMTFTVAVLGVILEKAKAAGSRPTHPILLL